MARGSERLGFDPQGQVYYSQYPLDDNGFLENLPTMPVAAMRLLVSVDTVVTASSGSIFRPASPEAGAIAHLFVISLWICGGVFAVVAGLVGYSMARFRWREGEPEPEQIAGNRRVEVIWLVVPFCIVALLFGLTVRAMSLSDPPLLGKPDLEIIGHQWWWEVRDLDWGYVSANEIHIPVGRQISIRLDTADVLHEFWVPELTRKITAVPQAGNHLWIEADRAGVYEGVCTEFCGTQHAWMRFEVVAQEPAQFEAWARHQEQAAPLASRQVAEGARLFRGMTCINCHAVRGTDATGTAGPDLTHFADRRLLGAGVVPNTDENLRRWLANPQTVKPGVKMPNFKLTDEQIGSLAAYLESLR